MKYLYIYLDLVIATRKAFKVTNMYVQLILSVEMYSNLSVHALAILPLF